MGGEGREGGGQNLGLRVEKRVEGVREAEKSAGRKVKKSGRTDIKGFGWREVYIPHPPPRPSPSPSPIQLEMAEMSNPGIKVSRNGQFAVK